MKFEKNIHCFGRAFVENKEAVKRKTTDRYSAELIGYQTQAVRLNNCTVFNSKQQSLKGCRGFPVFLLVIFLKTRKVIVSNHLPTLLRSRLSQEIYLLK